MLLAIYLNDHLAGATLGVELARRAASSNGGNRYGPFLTELARDVGEDRRSLVELMTALDVSVDRVKTVGAWAMEKIGRLKLNGRLRGYSPLSRVIELEGLALGVRGKLALWDTLRELQPQEPALAAADLGVLRGRAESQLEGLEVHRLLAVAEAFGEG
ncbi:MAG: hypothetical protein ACRDPM_00085 [Solirubrobacteraceae bacterium]